MSSFLLPGFYAVIETTSHPPSVAKPETFQSLSLTTGLDCCLFNGAELCSLFGDAALRGTQITANTRNAFPPGGLWRLREEEEEEEETRSQSGCDVCQIQDSSWLFFFLQSASDDMHTNKRAFRGFTGELIVSVCCQTLTTAGTH